jgi:hypothetical protein
MHIKKRLKRLGTNYQSKTIISDKKDKRWIEEIYLVIKGSDESLISKNAIIKNPSTEYLKELIICSVIRSISIWAY